jgi:DNA modification methylase
MEGDKAVMTFTSPPYNLGQAALLRSKKKDVESVYYAGEYDDEMEQGKWGELMRKFTDLALRVSQYVFVNVQMVAGNKKALVEYWWKFIDKFADVAIWDKGSATPAFLSRVMDSRFEFILVFSDKGTRGIGTREFRGMVHNVYEGGRARGKEYAGVHAAVFPVDLPEHFVETFSNPGEVVYEPFCGTGTTMLACERLGRECRAVELSPVYVACTLERMHKAYPEMIIEQVGEVPRKVIVKAFLDGKGEVEGHVAYEEGNGLEMEIEELQDELKEMGEINWNALDELADNILPE